MDIDIDKQTIVKALQVAVVVGTVLLVINQFDALFGESKLRVIPALLTYCVPIAVFLAGRFSNKRNKIQSDSLY